MCCESADPIDKILSVDEVALSRIIIDVESTDDPVESLLGFFTTHEIGTACNISDWTISQEVGLYADIAKGTIPAQPNVRMAAAGRLRKLIFMALRLGGHVSDTSRKAVLTGGQGDSQHTLTQTQHTTRLIADTMQETERMLMAGVAGEDLHGSEPSGSSADSERACSTADGDSNRGPSPGRSGEEPDGPVCPHTDRGPTDVEQDRGRELPSPVEPVLDHADASGTGIPHNQIEGAASSPKA